MFFGYDIGDETDQDPFCVDDLDLDGSSEHERQALSLEIARLQEMDAVAPDFDWSLFGLSPPETIG